MRDASDEHRGFTNVHTRRIKSLCVLLSAAIMAAIPILRGGDSPRQRLNTAICQLPLMFEQMDSNSGEFYCHGAGYGAFLSPGQITLVVRSTPTATRDLAAHGRGASLVRRGPSQAVTLRISLEGVDPDAKASADRAPTTLNYFLGNNPDRWRRQVPAYSRIRYSELYPGIDLVYYGNQRQLESDFVVRSGADPRQIRFRVEGGDTLNIDPSGDLIVRTAAGDVRLCRPRVYQEKGGRRREVVARYILGDGRSGGDRLVNLEVGSYDLGQPLTIDPVLVYSDLLGGIGNDTGWSVAVDSGGNTVIVGETTSTNFYTTNAIFPVYRGNPLSPGLPRDVFVAKVDPSGTNFIFSTFLGGTEDDASYSVALDGAGNIYLAGQTTSADFPVTLNAVSRQIHGTNFAGYYPYDAFVTKLDAGGSNLLYSTYLGGAREDAALSIAVDNAGAVYLTGFTSSIDFPTVNSSAPFGGGRFDAFVTKLTATNSTLIYSTVFGGLGDDRGDGIRIDAAGEAIVAGLTDSRNFPLVNAYQTNYGGGLYDVFVTKFSADGTTKLYSTYLGGSGDDEGYNLAVDAAGNAYVTGITTSFDFPVHNALYSTNSGSSDIFVTELDTTGTNLIYSTYFGGSFSDDGWGIAVGADGSAYVVGSTTSTNFITTDRIQLALRGGSDAVVFGLAPGGTSLLYSVALGGIGGDVAYGVALDADGNVIVTGSAGFINFPLLPSTNGLPYTGFGLEDAFLAKIYPGSLSLSVQRLAANDVAISWPGLFFNYELQSTDVLEATNIWTTVTNNPPAVVGTNLVVVYTNTLGNSFYRLQPRP